VVAVSAAGVRSQGIISAGALPWASMTKAVETDRTFLFYASKLQAVFLPKDVLPAQDVDAVRAVAREHLGKRFIDGRTGRRPSA
jgi:hypothetical protein